MDIACRPVGLGSAREEMDFFSPLRSNRAYFLCDCPTAQPLRLMSPVLKRRDAAVCPPLENSTGCYFSVSTPSFDAESRSLVLTQVDIPPFLVYRGVTSLGRSVILFVILPSPVATFILSGYDGSRGVKRKTGLLGLRLDHGISAPYPPRRQAAA